MRYSYDMKYIIVLLLLFPIFVSAQPIINEIAWMGSLVEGVDSGQEWRYEWIELFNEGDTIVLDGWSIELYRDKLDFSIPLSGILYSGEYLVFGASDKITGVDVSYSNLGGKFMNGGQRVVLRNSSGIVEELNARDGWFAGSNRDKKTMERKDSLRDAGDTGNWGTSLLVGGTPGFENTLYGTYGREVSLSFGESKKDLSRSSSINLPLYAAASLTALGSVLTALFLRRRLRFPW